MRTQAFLMAEYIDKMESSVTNDEGDMNPPFGGYCQSRHAGDKFVESPRSDTQGGSARVRLSK